MDDTENIDKTTVVITLTKIPEITRALHDLLEEIYDLTSKYSHL